MILQLWVSIEHKQQDSGLIGDCSFLLSVRVFRSGVRLQSVQSVSQRKQHSSQLCQDVHRPRGEQQWVHMFVSFKSACWEKQRWSLLPLDNTACVRKVVPTLFSRAKANTNEPYEQLADIYLLNWCQLFCFPWCLAGLCIDGLYRVSGNLAVIQKLRFAVNHGEFLLFKTASFIIIDSLKVV